MSRNLLNVTQEVAESGFKQLAIPISFKYKLQAISPGQREELGKGTHVPIRFLP